MLKDETIKGFDEGIIKLVEKFKEKGWEHKIPKDKLEYYNKLKNMKNKLNKEYKESNIMKARSDLKKNKDGKYSVDTEMNIKKGLEPKVKKALKKSVILELDKEIEGSGFRKIDLDYSSSEDEKPKKKRGRPPKKGKGLICDSDSESDDDEIKEYGKILSHLVSHIKDPKEPIDKKDFKQAIELIKKIKTKKA